MRGYGRFAGMIASSMIAMYILTYANSWSADHMTFSESRLYMVFYMGAAMAAIMLAFMWNMYEGRNVKFAILGSGLGHSLGATAVVFAVSLYLMRSQALIGDVSYMRAMIPHHSIAILTSERARITDPRVRELADGIIEAQLREIDQMKALIAELDND